MTHPNLLGRELGAGIVACSDEYFGLADNLLLRESPQRPGTYGLRGADVDGWESRRHNASHDWVIVRLAHPGRPEEIVVDTTGFRFNAPTQIGVDLSSAEGGPWHEILDGQSLLPNQINTYRVAPSPTSAAFLRLRIFPDGGIARLRAYGCVDTELSRPPFGARLSDIRLGCTVEASEGSFGDPWATISHSIPVSTHDGWETPRRSDASSHWLVFGWPSEIVVTALEVHAVPFVGNAAREISLEYRSDNTHDWVPGGTFAVELGSMTHIDLSAPPARFVRVRLWPDGGVARLWFYGSISPAPPDVYNHNPHRAIKGDGK